MKKTTNTNLNTMEKKLILISICLFIGSCAFSQEYIGYKSEDLVNLLKEGFLRNTVKSKFVLDYQHKVESYPKGIKQITISRDEYYNKTMIFENGRIVSDQENTPFEKCKKTYKFDSNGNVVKYQKQSTFLDMDTVVSEQTSNIKFNYYLDSLIEIHSFDNKSEDFNKNFSYTYVYNEEGNVAQKIAKSYNNDIDTTFYLYDTENNVTQETLNNGFILLYEYKDGQISQITKTDPKGKNKKETITKCSYYKKGLLKKVSYTSGEDNEIDISLKYDDNSQLIEFTRKTKEGKESTNEELEFIYNPQGYISEDWSGYIYDYIFDEKGNWTSCKVTRDGKFIETITRVIVYE